jgi:hypothetical protein
MQKRMNTIRAYCRQTWSRNLRRGSTVRVKLTEAQVDLVRRLWAEGVHRDEIARRVGITISTWYARRGDQLKGLPKRERGVGLKRSRGYVDPTPEEIAARCAEIQAAWTADQRAMRRVGGGNILRAIRLGR